MNKTYKRGWMQAAATLILLILLYVIIKQADITVEQILHWTPANPVLAVLILLLLYALKSVTIFVPLVVLEIAVGIAFPIWISLPLNLFGSFIDLTIPYWIGYRGGRKKLEDTLAKYPKLSILRIGQRHPVFESFLLRIIYLPGDIITVCLGALKTPYWPSVIGGLLGHLPSIVLATFMGASIQNPSSPAFWLLGVLFVVLSIVSVVGYYFYCRHESKY